MTVCYHPELFIFSLCVGLAIRTKTINGRFSNLDRTTEIYVYKTRIIILHTGLLFSFFIRGNNLQ